LAFRDVTSAIVERTSIFVVLPRVGCGHTCCLALLKKASPAQHLLFLANVNSLPFDYVARQKLGGNHLTLTVLSQLPAIPPDVYTADDVEFITSRALELSFTSSDLDGFARDVGHNGHPFVWEDGRRERILRDLDGYFAHLYGFTREELRYILDPKDVFDDEFPSETFRVLKEREEKEFGEYRTRRLVLEAFDKLAETPRFRDEMAKRKSAFGSGIERSAATATT
jgi:hypothetical protein